MASPNHLAILLRSSDALVRIRAGSCLLQFLLFLITVPLVLQFLNSCLPNTLPGQMCLLAPVQVDLVLRLEEFEYLVNVCVACSVRRGRL